MQRSIRTGICATGASYKDSTFGATVTQKFEIPFNTWESVTMYNPETQKNVSTSTNYKIPVLSIKTAAIVGVELEISINPQDRVMAPIPINPFQVSSDNTALPKPVPVGFK